MLLCGDLDGFSTLTSLKLLDPRMSGGTLLFGGNYLSLLGLNRPRHSLTVRGHVCSLYRHVTIVAG